MGAYTPLVTRPLSVALALALVLGTPGLPAWQAFANTGKAASGAQARSNVPGGQAGAQGGAAGVSGLSAVALQPLSLTGSIGLQPMTPSALVPQSALPIQTAGAASLAPQPVALSASPASPAARLAAPAASPLVAPQAVSGSPAAKLSAPSQSPVPGKDVPAASAAPALDAKGVNLALEEAGRKLSAKGADPAAILAQLYEGGVSAGALDALVQAQGEGRSGPKLSRNARRTLQAYANSRSAAAAALPGAPAAPAEGKKSLVQRVRGLFDLSEFNSSEKWYLFGQSSFLLALSVYLTTLPLLVKAVTDNAAFAGDARSAHFWTFGLVSLFAGAVVARSPMKRVLVTASFARAAIFGVIGVLAITHSLAWMPLLALISLNSGVVAHNHLVDADTGGAAKVFDSDKKIEKAGYIYDFMFYGLVLTIPQLLGRPLDWIKATYGPLEAAGAGFIVFSALMMMTAFVYALKVRTFGDPAASYPFKGVFDAVERGWGMVKTFGRILYEVPGRNWRTIKVIWANEAIRTRSMMATLENFIEDALFIVVIPFFALEILGLGYADTGLLTGAVYAGGLIASTMLVGVIQKAQAKYGTYRVLQALSFVAAAAFVPSILLWAAPSLITAVPAVLAMKLMLQPLRSRMRALLQTSIKNDPRAAPHADDIYSLMTFFEVMAAGLGGFLFTRLFLATASGGALASLGVGFPMIAVTGIMALLGVVYLFTPRMVRDSLDKPALKVHKSPEGNEEKMLAQLSKSLEENGLPPYTTETVTGKADQNRPTVVILAPASRHKVAIAREGGRQSPGDVQLVLDASWLTQEVYPDGRTKLLVRKAVVFDAQGRAKVVEYEDQRRARYFANYFTVGANGRDDGVVFETNLDVPQSNSLFLETVTNDKLGTRLLMAARGVSVPLTLALAMPLNSLAAATGRASSQGFTVAAMPSGEAKASEVARLIGDYLDRYEGAEVVGKPSGPAFHSGHGVKFFQATARDAVIAHALALSTDKDMTDDGAVLVDGRVASAPLKLADGRKAETTLRVLAARTPWDGFATTGVFARVGPWGKPTTAEAADPRDNATVEPWDSLLAQWKEAGLLNEATAAELDAEVRALGPAVFAALAEHEKTLPRKDGQSYQAQTDLIGLDVMIELRRDAAGRPKLVPVVIEVNDHDSGGQYNLDLANRGNPAEIGLHSREWMATALQRARRDALKGQRVVLVGAGYSGKRFIFEKAKELGVKIVLVDKRTPFVKELLRDGLIDELIETDNSKPKEALASAKKKLRRSIRKNGELGGITSFWEDDLPLTADLAAALNLSYHTQEAAQLVRSKDATLGRLESSGEQQTRRALLENLLDPTPEQLGAMRRDFLAALDRVGVPAVLKPVGGAAAIGTKKIATREEALQVFEEVRLMARPEVDDIFKFAENRNLILGEYFDGPEWDADIVMRDGVPLFVSLTDNWPTREPYFLATGSSLPSRRLSAAQQKEVEKLVIASAKALGLRTGVIHLEGKYTSKGARLIEANGRMGGEYVHDWVEAVWGVSLVEEGLMAAAGVKGTPFKAPQPLTHLEGAFLIPERSGVIEAFGLPEDARHQAGFHELRVKKQIGDRIAVPPAGYERAGMLVARGATSGEARDNLTRLEAQLLLQIK
jgi:hypothetical protein